MTYTSIESIVQGATYREKVPPKTGYVAYVRGTVNTSVLGDYEVTYTYLREDPYDLIIETKLVSVVAASGGSGDIDYTELNVPVVVLNGDSFLTIELGDDWQDPGATATVETGDGVTEDLPVVAISSVDVWSNAENGSYSILYYAVSKQGRMGFAIRTVNVGVEYRDPNEDTIAPGFVLDGCERLFVEYPTGTTKPIYVGSDYTGVGNHIFKDEGFTLDDPDDPTYVRMSIAVEDQSNQVCSLDYSNKAECEAAGGTWGYATTFPSADAVYFEANSATRKEFNIKYTVSDIYGNIRTRVRTVIMLAEGEQAEEIDQQVETGCLLNDDKKDIGDVIQDEEEDPSYDIVNETPIALHDISQETLDIMCAGDTAFFGSGPLATQKDFHPYEIPETIIETRYVSASDVTGVARIFTNTYDVPLPSGTVEMRSEGVAIWRLYKVHNRNLVTYSLGNGGLNGDPNNGIIFSSFHIGSSDGDIFYGRYGTHIFYGDPGWNRFVQQRSVAWQSQGRSLPPPASFTEVTDQLTADWIARASSTNNVAEQYVFYDENQQTLSRGGIVHSSPMFRGFYDSIQAGGASKTGDVLSLHWHNFGGGRNVEEYCLHVWQPRPEISISSNQVSVNEGQTATFSVSLNKVWTQTVRVDYITDHITTNDKDYKGVTGTLNFDPGETAKTISVETVEDTSVEGDEGFKVVLSNPINSTILNDQASVTIKNTTVAPGLSITPTLTVVEGTNAVLTVTLSKTWPDPVTVDYATANGTATAGSDYTAKSGTLTFAAGETSKTISVPISADSSAESDETFTVTLSNASGDVNISNPTGTVTITDRPEISINNATVSEGNSATLTVTMSKAWTSAISVNYATENSSAVAGSDYTATSGTLTFAAGQTSKTISVSTNTDLTSEGNETFVVNLSGATSPAQISDSQGVVTITNVAPPAPSLNIYCSFPREAHPANIAPPSGFVVPIGMYEIGWNQHSCYQNSACFPSSVRKRRLDSVIISHEWHLVRVTDSSVTYSATTGQTASITNNGASGLTFTGLLGTYTWSQWEYGNEIGSGGHLWMTNFSNKITNNAPSGRDNRSLSLYISTTGTASWYAWYNPWTNQGSWPANSLAPSSINNC